MDELADRPAVLRSLRTWTTLIACRAKLLLVVGEMDSNVDPSSTMQVVHRLIKHNKNFDLLLVPGANHGAARGDQYGAYGDRKRFDFFVRHLLRVTPPTWNH